MGAGASIEAGEAINDASKGTNVAVEALKVVENGAADAGQGISEANDAGAGVALASVGGEESANNIGQAAVVAGEVAGAEVEAFLASIEDEVAAGQAGAMINQASEVMTVDEVRDAVIIIKEGAVSAGQSSVLLVKIGGALNEASNMAPAVVDCVTGSLLPLAHIYPSLVLLLEHLVPWLQRM